MINYKKKLIEEKKKNMVCRNEYQRAIWDLAKKHRLDCSPAEFWVFFSGVDACLSLNNKELEELKKHR